MFNKPKTYLRRPKLRRVVATVAITTASLFALTVAMFFVLRLFVVYNADGSATIGGSRRPAPVVEPSAAPVRPPVDMFSYSADVIGMNVVVQVSSEPSYVSGDTDWTILFLPTDDYSLGFSILTELPESWSIELIPQRGFLGMRSMLLITDADGSRIGVIAHENFPEDPVGDITYDSVNGIYNLLPVMPKIANDVDHPDHQISVRSPAYAPVTETENGAVAVTVADYRWRANKDAPWSFFTNKVILAHDNIIASYVVIEFYDDALTDSQLKDIAVKVKMTLL